MLLFNDGGKHGLVRRPVKGIKYTKTKSKYTEENQVHTVVHDQKN